NGAPGDAFGRSLAVSGDALVVGAYLDDTGSGVDSGAIYFYKYRGSVLKWSFDSEKDGEAAYDNLGFSVALDQDLAVAGTYNHAYVGAAYVYRNSSNQWQQETVLTASDGANYDDFGVSVAVKDDLIVVGAHYDDTAAGADAGSAYVFRHVTGSKWIQEQQLQA